jgi:hypothetical protein
MIGEWLIRKDVEGSGRGVIKVSRHLTGGTEDDYEKFRIAGLRTEIWIRDLPNTKQEC